MSGAAFHRIMKLAFIIYSGTINNIQLATNSTNYKKTEYLDHAVICIGRKKIQGNRCFGKILRWKISFIIWVWNPQYYEMQWASDFS